VIQDRGYLSSTTKRESVGFCTPHWSRAGTRFMKLLPEKKPCRLFRRSVRISSFWILVYRDGWKAGHELPS
jgi:hypothetical protein